jgi:hypothetical protein
MLLQSSNGVQYMVSTELLEASFAILKEIVRIERPEKAHFLFEDADFAVATIKKLIKQGEEDTERALVMNNNQ